jgi:hypothetical protein
LGIVTRLLLRQQFADFKAGRGVSNHVPVRSISRMEKARLVDSFRATSASARRWR